VTLSGSRASSAAPSPERAHAALKAAGILPILWKKTAMKRRSTFTLVGLSTLAYLSSAAALYWHTR
jgi:hypothetical protein